MENKSEKQDLKTAWEILECTSTAISQIVRKTAQGQPELNSSEKEKIQTNLLLSLGALSLFSDKLANDSVHETVNI